MLFAADVTDWTTFDYVTGGLLVSVGIVYLFHRSFAETSEQRIAAAARQQLRDRQAAREPTPVGESLPADDEIPAEVAERVRCVLARIAAAHLDVEGFDIDPARLHLDDALDATLGWGLGDSLFYVDLQIELEQEFGVRWDFYDVFLWPGADPARDHAALEAMLGDHTVRDLARNIAKLLEKEQRVIERGVDYVPPRGTFAAWRRKANRGG